MESNGDINIALVDIMVDISSYMMKIYLFIQNISRISHDNMLSITHEHSSEFSENSNDDIYNALMYIMMDISFYMMKILLYWMEWIQSKYILA